MAETTDEKPRTATRVRGYDAAARPTSTRPGGGGSGDGRRRLAPSKVREREDRVVDPEQVRDLAEAFKGAGLERRDRVRVTGERMADGRFRLDYPGGPVFVGPL